MSIRILAIVAFSVLLLGCANKVPPGLTPQASLAFQATQAIKALDILRDTAIEAHAQTPPLVSEAATRQVVLYHQRIVKVVHAAPSGWAPAAVAGLEGLSASLTGTDKAFLVPYMTLVSEVLKEVQR